MSGIATAIVGGAVVGGGLSYLGSRDASKTSYKAAELSAETQRSAAEIQAEYQREALDYLKEREAIPREFSEEALTRLGGLYGLEGGLGSQSRLIKRAEESPLYDALMGGQEAGEDAILRHASATGGLRSGDVQSAMYDYNTQLQNQALLASYNQQLQGLTGLAGLPSNANQIAAGISGIGQTLGAGQMGAGQALSQGMVAGAQTQQMGMQNAVNTALGITGLGVQGATAADIGIFSDRRLKKNIKKLGKLNGHNFYSFDWNTRANELGLYGNTCGCMADEVFEKYPQAVLVKDGYLFVNYKAIGIIQ